MTLYYQSATLIDRINWDVIMGLPRYAGGHDEQMQALLKDATVVGHYNCGDCQGEVATCVRLNDTGEYVIYNDYYGSCSGCDAWEAADDADVICMCKQLATGAYIFKTLDDCLDFLSDDPDNYTGATWDWRYTANELRDAIMCNLNTK